MVTDIAIYLYDGVQLVTMNEGQTRPKRIAVQLPDDARKFLEKEAEETGVPISNLVSYIVVNYVREERKKRNLT